MHPSKRPQIHPLTLPTKVETVLRLFFTHAEHVSLSTTPVTLLNLDVLSHFSFSLFSVSAKREDDKLIECPFPIHDLGLQ